LKQKTIFDLLNDITFNKVPWKEQTESDQKKVQPFMMNRWFSMSKDYLDIIAYFQPKTDLMTNEQYYNFYLDLLPKQKFFVKYIKSQKELDSKRGTLLKFLSERLQLSEREVDYYLEITSKEEIKEYLHGCGFMDKQLKSDFGL
jgi:hypothetical protein